MFFFCLSSVWACRKFEHLDLLRHHKCDVTSAHRDITSDFHNFAQLNVNHLSICFSCFCLFVCLFVFFGREVGRKAEVRFQFYHW